jgi:hypothetical protein
MSKLENCEESNNQTDNSKKKSCIEPPSQGQFYVYVLNNDIKTKELINPLSQNELAHGWSLVLPRVNSKTRIHHFNIFLSHLPEHLWNQLHDNHTSNLYYNVITDKIYRYSVKKSENDNKLKELYNNVMNRKFNSDRIKELYTSLKNNNVKGWLMIRVSMLLNT